jgi:hypothetical protein
MNVSGTGSLLLATGRARHAVMAETCFAMVARSRPRSVRIASRLPRGRTTGLSVTTSHGYARRWRVTD